jgi:transketolase N-terminal domain/subunit/transketolase C-terminal domain/subunit
MVGHQDRAWNAQQQRNQQLIAKSLYMRPEVVSNVLPLHFDLATKTSLSDAEVLALQSVEIEAARLAVKSLASLAKIGELDHLGGGLDLMSALTLTLACTDYDKVEYTIENAHCSIGYYGVLGALGFLSESSVADQFRRSLDIPGHVSWVPGGTQLNGGRLGVMIPVAVGQALGKKAVLGKGSWVVCHTGDAGWISGQALNGFNAADLHRAPVTFVMHRNGIQLSGSNKQIMDKDPRPIIAAMGIDIIEVSSLHDTRALFAAYRQAYLKAQEGRPTLIYPVGYKSDATRQVTLRSFVSLDREVWIPGALMSYRDVDSMLECIFLVNDLPGGVDHHDGHMKGRDLNTVLANPMLTHSPAQTAALAALRSAPQRRVVTKARPAAGTANLLLPKAVLEGASLSPVGKAVSPRAGVELAYELVAKAHPDKVFVVSCDLDPSTKLGKARKHLKADHQFEVSIEEQLALLLVNGLAVTTPDRPQLNIVSTFAAFFEGIAREGFEMWRYQRNLNGVNEGLNVVFHMSHVGSCTGRDHFSGWSLDWITLGLGYLPYVHRFYTPADARSAFLAVVDQAAHYGAHILAIPRDNLPILTKQGTKDPLWTATDTWEPITEYRTQAGAKRAILALGATAFVAEDAAAALTAEGLATDVHVINGFPFGDDQLEGLIKRYPAGLVTIEDGIIATRATGLRGLAGVVASAAYGSGTKLDHVGIVDPRIAPADGHPELWEHFGLTKEALVTAIKAL